MSDQFNELLLQTLKEVGVRLERLEGRTDHVINEKADKIDVVDVKTDLKHLRVELKAVYDRLDTKADKTDVNEVKTELKAVYDRLDTKAGKTDVNEVKAELNEQRDELRSQGLRLDRIETGIRTLQWTMTAGLAVLGIILAFIKVL